MTAVLLNQLAAINADLAEKIDAYKLAGSHDAAEAARISLDCGMEMARYMGKLEAAEKAQGFTVTGRVAA